ncbi:MAG: hypothetical protein M3022_17555 [Actinomycetota bacterium]|nr:hypothetical protein [Actinomycetota bacterium]
MDWKQIADRAKQVADKRGGSESLKQDAAELRDIAQGKGSLSEKLGRAAQAIKKPGASREPGVPQEPVATGHPEPPAPASRGGDTPRP